MMMMTTTVLVILHMTTTTTTPLIQVQSSKLMIVVAVAVGVVVDEDVVFVISVSVPAFPVPLSFSFSSVLFEVVVGEDVAVSLLLSYEEAVVDESPPLLILAKIYAVSCKKLAASVVTLVIVTVKRIFVAV